MEYEIANINEYHKAFILFIPILFHSSFFIMKTLQYHILLIFLWK